VARNAAARIINALKKPIAMPIPSERRSIDGPVSMSLARRT
jgi:hypothetical protein